MRYTEISLRSARLPRERYPAELTIYPVVDIYAGRAVRLRQGDFARADVFYSDPVQPARRWLEQGAGWLHVVDLDGARAGHPVNSQAIADIANLPIKLQLGGGLRTIPDIEAAFARGVDRVVLGTVAVKDAKLLADCCARFSNRVVIGIDARDGVMATEGWQQSAGPPALEFAKRCQDLGAAAIVYTDIERDGMLQGINAAALAAMCNSVETPVIASGGVASLDDITLARASGAAGVIIGRALFDGRIELADALALATE